MAEQRGVRQLDWHLENAWEPPYLPASNESFGPYAAKIVLGGCCCCRRLDGHQMAVMSVALGAFPRRSAKPTDIELKNIARIMVHFWQSAIGYALRICGKLIIPDLGRLLPQADLEVTMLSWLEIPLRVQTQAPGPGKMWLFEMARWYAERNARRFRERMAASASSVRQ